MKISIDQTARKKREAPTSLDVNDLMRRLNDIDKGLEASPMIPKTSRPHSARIEISGQSQSRQLLTNPPSPVKLLTPNLETKARRPPRAPTAKIIADCSLNYCETENEIIGQSYIDYYIIEDQIGRGSYATVYRAYYRPSKSRVALKCYEKSGLQANYRKTCIRREINILKALSHPNIIRLNEVITTQTHINLSLELVLGESLDTYLKRQKNSKFKESNARAYFKQILEAVDYIHGQGVAHRDLKLENVLIDRGNKIKIIDFGLSTLESENQMEIFYCGTPTYMAPEIFNKAAYFGKPADVWALGIMLYALLCGTFPFIGKNSNELSKKIQSGTFSVDPDLSKGARNFINRMLVVNPLKRASTNELLNDEWLSLKGCSEPTKTKNSSKSSSSGRQLSQKVIGSLVRNI